MGSRGPFRKGGGILPLKGEVIAKRSEGEEKRTFG
jgi:hypothetical protein